MVLAKRKGQKLILFERINLELMPREDSESENESPQFAYYEPNVLRMMENMGYDLTKNPGLNFGKGRRTLLRSFVPKWKTPDLLSENSQGVGLCVNFNPVSL